MVCCAPPDIFEGDILSSLCVGSETCGGLYSQVVSFLLGSSLDVLNEDCSDSSKIFPTAMS